MSNTEAMGKRKRPGYMKWYPEKWLGGSTRDEMTHSERAIYADLLCKAYSNDPLGQVDFTSIRRLANELHASQKLLMGTIRKGVKYNKLRVIRVWQDPISLEKYEESELTLEQLRSDQETFASKRSKSGVRLYAIIIIGWNACQTAFLRQSGYPKKSDEDPKSSSDVAPNSEHDGPIGEERKGDEKRKDIEENEQEPPKPESISSPLPSPPPSNLPLKGKTLKEEFLSLLRSCPGYPFETLADALLYDYAVRECLGINVIEQTQLKIAWWKDHPDALRADPRGQLKNFFRKEYEFKQRGGPQPIGELLGIDDPDHRKFMMEAFSPRIKKKRSDES